VIACASQFLVGADGLAVAIALPGLRRGLGLTPLEAQWVLTAYGLCLGGGLLLGGRLGDVFGRRRMLICGMALFAAGAVAAALAPALGVLIAARAAQGAGSAAAIPAALALIGSLFPPGRGRTRGLSLLAGMASVGTIAGLLLGGTVTTLLGWRWVFWVTAPLALATAVAAPLVLPEAKAEDLPRRIDAPGALLVTAAALALLLGLTRVEASGPLSLPVLGPVATGVALAFAAAAWERRASAPLFRFSVLRVHSLRSATLGVGINAVTFTAIVYVGTLWLQDGLGYSAAQAGAAIAPLEVVAFAVSLAGVRVIAGRSPRSLLLGSFALGALALAWLARAPEHPRYALDILPALVVLGVTMCVVFMVSTRGAVADVDGDDTGMAAGTFETANHLFGGAAGVAAYATVVAASGYGAGFATAAGLAALGCVVALRAPGRPPASA
jgi:MFS family permease